MTDVDAFRLPAGILGLHPDDFYGAIGRIVCVCAVLEDQVTTLRHTLAKVQPGQLTHEPVGQQINAARTLTETLPEHAARSVGAFLDTAQETFDRRNAFVHSSFPAQPDGRLWGHRPTRHRAITDGRADTVETDLTDLRAFIGELSKLVTSFNGVHALAAAGRHA